MIKVLVVPLAEDLTEFTRFLWRHEIPHRVLEKDATQELWVAYRVNPEQIRFIYDLWQQGQDLGQLQVSINKPKTNNLIDIAKQAWLSCTLILASVMLSLLIGFGDNLGLMRHFTFTDLLVRGDSIFTTNLLKTFESLQLWRLFTPIFLHFSLIHILFNGLWVWIVGTKIEINQGRSVLLALVALSAVSSNFAQYWVSGPLFGGLSGVVFAFLGYVWLWDRICPERKFGFPPALMGFVLLMLALGYSGAMESLGLGAIANTAHLVGLISGIAFAPLMKVVCNLRR